MKGIICIKEWCEVNINLPKQVIEIFNVLKENGYNAYVVGGCVRDSLLNKIPNDWDICTNALPSQIQECFKNYKVIETGLQHGTLTIMIDDISYEITTFRVDGEYEDNRRPSTVTFTDNIKEDLSRRDFTINSMAYNNEVGLIDSFGGANDLNSKIVKCVGNANTRFNEDGLRILRALRFASVLGFDIETQTKSAIFKNKDLLNNISKERIMSEFNKLIIGKNGVKIIREYKDIIFMFIPELQDCVGFEQNNQYHIYDVFEHILHSVESCPNDLVLKLTMLLHDIGKPQSYTVDENGNGHFYGHSVPSSEMAETILKRLKYDNDTIKNVTQLVLYHDIEFVDSKRNVKRLLNKFGEKLLRRLLIVRVSDMKAHSDKSLEKLNMSHKIEHLLNEIIKEQQCFSLKDLDVNGIDLIGLGYKQGKEIGKKLNYLLDLVINDEVENKKELLLGKL